MKKNYLELVNTLLLLVQIIVLFTLIHKINGFINTQTTISSSAAQQIPFDNVHIANVSIDDDPSMGNPNAPITIIEFSDFECPFCAKAEPKIKDLLKTYPNDIHFIYRDAPIESIHPYAFDAAQAANCAQDQGKYWEFHDMLFSIQEDLSISNILIHTKKMGLNHNQLKQCIESGKYTDEVRNDMKEAESYTVDSTPTFFVNGYKVVGVEGLESQINALLKKEHK